MSEKEFRRFSGYQIIFHWTVAVPYVLLLFSGGLLILSHLRLLKWIPQDRVATLHRWTGVALIGLLFQLLFAGLVTGHIRTMARDIADWFHVRFRDLLWLAAVPLHILLPRWVPLPRAGRFNAGQKTHGAFIVLAICAFGLTGIAMILRPADLRAWIVHTWLFVGAVSFLTLHLFLGLINPPTRRALKGIFTGWVPLQYIREHHPLTLQPPAERVGHHAVVSRVAVSATAVVVVGIAASLLWWHGPQRSAAEALQIWQAEHPAVMPGPLARVHADDPRTASCEACHEGLKPPSNSACLACHEKIGQVMQTGLGFHGQVKGECRTCHADHRGRDADLRGLDTRAFNHTQAQFLLQGRHSRVACDKCHMDHSGVAGELRFVGLSFESCSDCHHNPHQPQMSVSRCDTCHSENGWTGQWLLFEHNRDSSFKLDRIHATLQCAACHTTPDGGMQYRGTSTTCADCHAPIAKAMAGTLPTGPFSADPHNGRVTCSDCHSSAEQTNTTAFADACVRCHNDRYRSLFFEWSRSLDERVALATPAAHDDQQAKEIAQARKIGLHNIAAAVKILDELAKKPGPQP